MHTPSPIKIPSKQKTPVLEMIVAKDGWYDFTMKVEWDPMVYMGERFAHTKPKFGEFPYHSEAIKAAVVNNLTNGVQMLRSTNYLTKDTVLVVEVWQDSGVEITLLGAEMNLDEI